ncbi:MAG: hypothetical protein ACRD3W_05460, partial [Terriglobales bacterium]
MVTLVGWVFSTNALTQQSLWRAKYEAMGKGVVATEADVCAFWRHIRAAKKASNDQRERTPLQRLNQSLGNPAKIPLKLRGSFREMIGGLRLYGDHLSGQGTSRWRQSIAIFT